MHKNRKGGFKETEVIIPTPRTGMVITCNSLNQTEVRYRDTKIVNVLTTVKIPGDAVHEVLKWKKVDGQAKQVPMNRPAVISFYNDGKGG